jgi:hypothetical protein
VPCNWHQATIFFAGSDDPADAAMKAWSQLMLFAGLVIVAFQVVAALGVLFGVAFPACKTSKQCGQAGTFCARNSNRQQCQFCGWHGPLSQYKGDNIKDNNMEMLNGHESYVDCDWSAKTTLVGRTEVMEDTCLPPPNKTLVRELCNDYGNYKNILTPGGYPTEEAMGGARIDATWVQSWCEACVNAVDWEPDMFTTIDLGYDNVDAMGLFDWVTLVLASYVVALIVNGELKDIELCNISIERLGEKIGRWRYVFAIGSFLRRATFLPIMLGIVGLLVIMRGGDSLSVCFNTVAILFMTEVSTLSFPLTLG